MIRHWQIHVHQLEERTHKPFDTAIGQMKDFFDGQHDANGLITIIELAAALFFATLQPGLFKVIAQPKREGPALHQRFVVFGPILDAV